MDTGLHKKHKRHQFPEKRKYLPLGSKQIEFERNNILWCKEFKP